MKNVHLCISWHLLIINILGNCLKHSFKGYFFPLINDISKDHEKCPSLHFLTLMNYTHSWHLLKAFLIYWYLSPPIKKGTFKNSKKFPSPHSKTLINYNHTGHLLKAFPFIDIYIHKYFFFHISIPASKDIYEL